MTVCIIVRYPKKSVNFFIQNIEVFAIKNNKDSGEMSTLYLISIHSFSFALCLYNKYYILAFLFGACFLFNE